MQVRFLPYFKDSVIIEDYIKNAKEYFDTLPPVCPFCGWIGNDPLHHGYSINGELGKDEDWICPILWLARNIRHLHAARTIEFLE